MGKMQFTPDRLQRLLEPFGFALNLPESLQYGISFIRPSTLPRLYEHLLISADNAVHAETAISAATFTKCEEVVSIRDTRLRVLLSGNSMYLNTNLRSRQERSVWVEQLVQSADEYCTSSSLTYGETLANRLQPMFDLVDKYSAKVSDLFLVFDREYAYVNEIREDVRLAVSRMSTFARRWLYLNAEDAELASTILVRHWAEVEGGELPETNGKLGRFTARLILLTSLIGQQRCLYLKSGGIYR